MGCQKNTFSRTRKYWQSCRWKMIMTRQFEFPKWFFYIFRDFFILLDTVNRKLCLMHVYLKLLFALLSSRTQCWNVSTQKMRCAYFSYFPGRKSPSLKGTARPATNLANFNNVNWATANRKRKNAEMDYSVSSLRFVPLFPHFSKVGVSQGLFFHNRLIKYLAEKFKAPPPPTPLFTAAL